MNSPTLDDPQPAGAATATLRIRPLSERIGAEIAGADVRRMDDAAFREVLDTLARHHLVVVREQHLTEKDIETFARRFGEVEGQVFRLANGELLSPVHLVSNLDADGKPSVNPHLNANYFWHSDKAFMPKPAWVTMLYGVEIPEEGGDTQFANMAVAYDTLPDATKARIDRLQVLNCFDHMLETTGKHRRSEEDKKNSRPTVHPMVRVDPVSGRKSLFLTMYTKEVVGMDPVEGRALIDPLIEHATKPENVYTFKWRKNDLLFWDNRNLNHRAVANYDMSKVRRVLQRVVVRGQ
ncbi:TauD/TfdA dioxygenase family protein [Ramlibacter sp.]|uniref:TauD/TfdA dioxygenase family protein n=1 Tax=Ramlibacter sp. TaxID=1917967 RepID=UPI003D12A250